MKLTQKQRNDFTVKRLIEEALSQQLSDDSAFRELTEAKKKESLEQIERLSLHSLYEIK